MKTFDWKQHVKESFAFAKEAGKGAYPSEKAVRIGCRAGLGLGGVLLAAGLYGLTQGAVYGFGCTLAGIAAGVSNGLALHRIRNK